MFPLFETICIRDGIIQHIDYHLARQQAAYFSYYKKAPSYDFTTSIAIPKTWQKGLVKLKVLYNETDYQYLFSPYNSQPIQTLKIIQDNSIDYALKYTDRSQIAALFQQKDHCDDILIIKNGLVTDTSYCNIVFFDGAKWVTPLQPLLKGTASARLLAKQTIFADNIPLEAIHSFTYFRLINAMRPFEKQVSIPIKNIMNE